MRTMVDLGRERGPIGMHIITSATTVDCSSRDVGLRRSLRSLLDFIVPNCCNAGFEYPEDENCSPNSSSSSSSSAFSSDTDSPTPSSSFTNHRALSSSSTTMKATFFGQRNGRVSFCLQDDNHHHHKRTPSRRMTTNTSISSFTKPLLLLEFAVTTSYLAKEMQHGLLRIALVEEDSTNRQQPTKRSCGIFEVPVWSMYCNGCKVGYATRRKTTAADTAILTRMQSVSVGAGVLPQENDHGTDGIMYLRASFNRIIGSPNSESFHMINPEHDGRSSSNSHSDGQELSIFLLRSSS